MNTATQLTAGDWCGADPFHASFRDNPYPALNALREKFPVNLTPVGTYRISRYDDVLDVFKKASTSMTLANGESPNFHPADERGSFREFMLNLDGAPHLRLRKLVYQSFNNRTLRKLDEEVKIVVDEAVASALARGHMEIVGDLAHYLPAQIICRIMGIPLEDRDLFTQWTAARTNAFFARFLPEDVIQSLVDAGNSLADYFDDLVKIRRQNLQDDLLSELIRAEEDGDRLLDGELVIQAIGVLVAGFETTIGLIGNGLRALLDHPEQMQLLRERPELINNCVEECLRYDTPIVFNWRVLTEPYVVGGIELPADAVIWQMLASANRDPRRFEDPDKFRIDRQDVSHQSFGGGSHFCLGNQLAKLEARYAIGAFAQATRGLAIDTGELEWSESFFRVLGKYQVIFR